MGFSSLVNGIEYAASDNYTNGRKGYKVCKFTPHHMAGKLTAKRCCELFQNSSRNASANYCIGYNGELYGCVDENNRAWTSSSSTNDCQAITVEVANSSTGGDWPISDAAWNTLVNLAEDVCRRYGFRLAYDGTKNGSLTTHDMFAATNCPGPYLKSRLNELARIVNERLDGKQSEPAPQPTPAPAQEGYLVTITTAVLNVRQGPGTNYPINTTVKEGEVYTIVGEDNGWGKLKSGAGWISLKYTKRTENTQVPAPTPAPAAPKYTTGTYKVTASLLNVRSGPGTNYPAKTYNQLTANAQKQNGQLGNKKANGLLKGCVCTVSEVQNEFWGRIPSGWISLKYCEKQ